MAPEITLQSQLIGRGLDPNTPSSTYTDFADRIAKNWRDQAEMEQNLAAAKETLAQSKIATRQKTAAEAAGYNPELIGTMSKDQALEAVKLAMKVKKVKVEDDILDEWYAQLPALVKSTDVEAFINSLTKTTGMNVWASTGTVKQYTEGDKMYNSFVRKDGKIAKVWDPKTGYPVYSSVEDNMAIHDVPLEEAQRMIRDAIKQEAGQERRFGLMEDTRDMLYWSKLQKEMNIYNAPAARAIGQASVNNMRADRALSLLDKDGDLTPPEYDIIATDLAAIFKGGVPDIISLDHQRYSTLMSDLASKLQYFKSSIQPVHLPEIRKRLRDVTMDVKKVDNEVIKDYLTSVATGYEDTIKSDIPRFIRMVNAQLARLDGPLLQDVDDLSIVEHFGEYLKGKIGSSAKKKEVKEDSATPTKSRKPLSDFNKQG